MSDRILFVDDDPNILNAFRRQLRKQFQLKTATSGQEGLEILQQEGPFSVVVADMRMPEMDGIAFLKKVQELAPESVRLMLTGNADQQTAIDAVNEGNVFRFMTKPCPIELLVNTLEAAQSQYQLIIAERELLEGTLNGSIKLLMEILSLTSPTFSSQDISLWKMATEVARMLKVMNIWEMKIATMLSHVAYITLPPETLAKMQSGEPLTGTEQRIIDHLPETGQKLLANIPRLEGVANIVRYQNKNFDGTGFPSDAIAGEDIPIESRILKVLHDLKQLEETKDIDANQALELMQKNSLHYDPRVMKTIIWLLSSGEDEIALPSLSEVRVSELLPGQVLVSNVETVEGSLLFTAGLKLSETHVEKLINYHHIHRIKEPIQVSVTAEKE